MIIRSELKSRLTVLMGPKRNREDFMIRRKNGEVIERHPGFLNGSDFAISNCNDCEIYVCDHLA